MWLLSIIRVDRTLQRCLFSGQLLLALITVTLFFHAGFAGSTWDLYSYCGNDPINKYDPTGRYGKEAFDSMGSDFSSYVDQNGYGSGSGSDYLSMGRQ